MNQRYVAAVLLVWFSSFSIFAGNDALTVTFAKDAAIETTQLRYNQWNAFMGKRKIAKSEFFLLTGQPDKAISFKDAERKLTADRALMWTSFGVGSLALGGMTYFGIKAFSAMQSGDTSLVGSFADMMSWSSYTYLAVVCGAVGLVGALAGISFADRINTLKKTQTVDIDFIVMLRDDYNRKR